ncbi:hypothetical protein MauCBS54593_007245 [Microsporum audouinii]
MSGRRLLDAITFLNASRGVAKKHIVLQRHALDHHARTSSLTKEAKNQIQRIGLAVQAASDLAKKLDGDPAPSFTPRNRNHGSEKGTGSSQQGTDDSPRKNDITTEPIGATAVGTERGAEFALKDTLSPEIKEKEEELPEEMMQQLFRSRKVTRSLFQGQPHKTGQSKLKLGSMSMPHSRPTCSEVVTETITEAQDAKLNIPGEIEKRDHVEKDVNVVAPQDTYQMVQSRVPSSRIGRLWEYGGLATSMAIGVVGAGFRRATGGDDSGSLLLSPANVERLVAKLSKMRGAALKLGQMLSLQGKLVLFEQLWGLDHTDCVL